MEPQIIRINQITELLNISKTTLWRLRKDDSFPKEFKLGERSIGFLLSDINKWLEKRRA